MSSRARFLRFAGVGLLALLGVLVAAPIFQLHADKNREVRVRAHLAGRGFQVVQGPAERPFWTAHLESIAARVLPRDSAPNIAEWELFQTIRTVSLTTPRATPTRDDMSQVARLPNLERLMIEGREPDHDQIAPVLGQLVTLKQLDLRWGRFTDAHAPSLVNLQNLTWLDLSHSAIGSNSGEAIGRLSKLQTLDVSGTQIDDGFIFLLGDGPARDSLQSISLSYTHVTDQGIWLLRKFKRLRGITVSPGIAKPQTLQQLKSQEIFVGTRARGAFEPALD